ncbi:amino acid adenylation domain-containing protein [Micromonospora sp. NPDC048170]|uniref:non-ribosomal peptide synthetase n=1 Tax=Micromonospora sp. NPDC048170 TaxID=3154819 RepID=UPI0033ED2AD6
MVQIPVTPSQRSLLFIQEAVPRKDLYNISFRVVFDTAVDEAALRRALDRLIAVQPTLRTRFDAADGEPVAEIRPPMPAPMDVERVDCPPEQWPARLAEQSRRFAATPVDLRQAPLCRFRLLVGPVQTALLCNVHHAINDGVSMRVFLDELVEGYRLAGATGAGPAGVVEDVDVVQRERWLVGELAAQCRVSQAAIEAGEVEALAATLAGVPPTLLYPVPERPVDTRFNGRLRSVVLPPEQRAAVERTARTLGTTPYCLLLSCYALLLGDYSGNAEVIVGGPFVNRRTIASHDLCGFFVNTLPVVLPARHRPFAEQCAEVSGAVRAARRFQSIPFDALVAAVGPERGSNRNPLFQCMFAMQDDLVTRREIVPGLGMRLEYTHNETAKFDIWLAATPVSDGLELELEWDSDLLPDAYAHRFLDEYVELLARVVADPTGDTGPLTAASAHRRQPALHAGGRADTAGGRGLLALLRESAAARPEAVAISAPDAPDLSYAGLMDRADRIAAALSTDGVGAGDVVAIVPHSLPDTTAAMVAVLRCGAAYLPLDLSLPADRLSYMLRQAGCRYVVSPAPVTSDEPPRASVDDLADRGADLPVPAQPSGTDPIYVMFTSGSTGQPKGVHMGQDPLVNLLRWQIDAMGMGPTTRFLQYAPLGFDVSYQEIFPTLVAGGTVYGLGATDRRDLDAVARLVDRARLTHIYLPVAVLGAFAASVTDADLALADLEVLNVSGEQLHLDSRSRALLGRMPGKRLINLYGPTETHAVTVHTLAGGAGQHPSHVPIGLPLAGVDVHLLDAEGRPVPPGAAGEVFLGGICPADGYINDPDRTDAAFRPDPFTDPPGRMYRTGDLAVAADGPDGPTLIFLGRRDGQVKIRGHRVELGEVEIAAERLPAVAAAAAAVHGSGESAALCLFVRTTPGGAFDERAIRAALQQTLPTYMIPKHIVAVDAIPLTPNGKVDRSALAARFDSGELRPAKQRDADPDWSPTGTEELLAGLWERLLGRRPQSPQDSFFVLGGTSFDMLKLIDALRVETGLRIAVSDVFRRPTLAALASLVDERGATTGSLALATGRSV